jgi:hypothetical protein
LYFLNKFFGHHGGRRGVMAQALDQWQHPVSLSEALDVLHLAVRPVSYRCIRMAIEITSDSPAFFIVVAFIVGHNRS